MPSFASDPKKTKYESATPDWYKTAAVFVGSSRHPEDDVTRRSPSPSPLATAAPPSPLPVFAGRSTPEPDAMMHTSPSTAASAARATLDTAGIPDSISKIDFSLEVLLELRENKIIDNAEYEKLKEMAKTKH